MSSRFGPTGLAQRFQQVSPLTQGALYMLLSGFCFSLMNVCIRMATEDGLHWIQTAFFRNLLAFGFILPWVLHTRFAGARTRRLGQHFWRAAAGVAGMFLWFASVAFLPLAQATALNFTFPLFGTILAALLLKEDVRARRWTATLVGFLGVLVVLQPWQHGIQLPSLLPVAAALFMALSSILVKSLSRTEAPGTVVLYMNLFMTLLSLGPAIAVWQWPTSETWGVLVVLGFFAAVSHVFLTRAYARADASFIQPFDYLRLPLMAMLAYFLFSEIPTPSLWLGAAIIVGASLYIVRREAQVARQHRASLQLAGEGSKELP